MLNYYAAGTLKLCTIIIGLKFKALYNSKKKTDSHDEIMIGIGAWAGKGVPKTRQDSHKMKKRR